MSTKLQRRAGIAAAAIASCATLAAPAGASFHGQPGYALDSANRIHTFALGNPAGATAKPITGLAAGDVLVGIDERPRTGQLYGVAKGSGGTATAYTINPATGAATSAFALSNSVSLTPVVLTGTSFGVDFNPAADALRIIGNDGQNLRAIPSDTALNGSPRAATGTTFTDGTLSYSPIGSMPRPAATGIDAAAYTNSIALPTTTQLFNIDTPNADVTLQSPPNDGTQVKQADVALNGRPVQGFDILTQSEDSAVVNTGFVALGNTRVTLPPRNLVDQLLQLLGLQQPRTELRSSLSTISTSTGALSGLGTFTTNGIVDIAVDEPASGA